MRIEIYDEKNWKLVKKNDSFLIFFAKKKSTSS